MKEEQTYERLLQTLREMQAEIAERVRPVAEQAVRSEVDRLREQSEQCKNVLVECLTHIDQSILKCRRHMTEYHRTRSDLNTLNERLTSLGAEPVVVPEPVITENLADLIMARVAELRAEGKI